MKLTEDGKCPIDLVKPLTYRRDKMYYCTRCSREFHLATGKWRQSNAWIKPYTMQGSAAVVAARDKPEHTHEWLIIPDNNSYTCVRCEVGINAKDFLQENTYEPHWM